MLRRAWAAIGGGHRAVLCRRTRRHSTRPTFQSSMSWVPVMRSSLYHLRSRHRAAASAERRARLRRDAPSRTRRMPVGFGGPSPAVPIAERKGHRWMLAASAESRQHPGQGPWMTFSAPPRSRKTHPDDCPLMGRYPQQSAGSDRPAGVLLGPPPPEISLISAVHTHALCMHRQKRSGGRRQRAGRRGTAAHRAHLAAHTLHRHAYAGLIRPREIHPRNPPLQRAPKRTTAGQAPAPLHEVHA